jgi:hypothetical protein
MRFLSLSSDATCERCEGALRAGEVVALSASEAGRSELLLHPACALVIAVDSFVRALETTTTVTVPDRDALEQRARRRQVARRGRADARWTVREERGAPRSGVAPKREFEDDCVIEPTRDSRGRPTVRALVHGALSERFWSALRARRVWSSATREYFFVEPAKGREVVPVEDPTQPLVAHVFVVDLRAKLPDQAALLWPLRALGAPRPLLWILGAQRNKLDPESVAATRAVLDRAGYVGDECPVVTARRVDNESLATLVDALDEHFDRREFRVRGQPAQRFAEALLEDVVRGRDVAELRAALSQRVSYALWGRTDRSDATLIALWDALFERGELDLCAALLASGAVDARARRVR